MTRGTVTGRTGQSKVLVTVQPGQAHLGGVDVDGKQPTTNAKLDTDLRQRVGATV